MYSRIPTLVLGFHGCDKQLGLDVISGKTEHLQKSQNSYGWLGHGIYFWETNPKRAYEYACTIKKEPKTTKQTIEIPYVIGAILDLGSCLNLAESKSLDIIKKGYKILKNANEKIENPLPENQCFVQGKPMKRNLDCTVIETVHEYVKNENIIFDSVRGIFVEGTPLYPESGFNEKNHIQICIKNTNCIKGYFRVLEMVD